jgi:hypothetical protein
MKIYKESLKLRQMDVKPAAKIMANQHIEKGNFKKTLDLLKFMGKKVKIDKSSEKTSKAIWTIEATMEKSLEEAMLNEFSDAQLAQLKKAYANLDRINVTSPTYKKLKAMIANMDVKALEKVARAKVKFVSQIAAREYEKKSGNRLKAKDYMESVEEKRDAGKSATGYDIYHDTYSAAMQHAYAHAKKKHGVTVRPSEIDNKVALGPSKPSNGKTVSHILKTDKKQNLHVQVYNTGRKYELNMYVESVELDEQDVKVPLELLKLYNKGMALPAGSIAHKKVIKQIDDMRKKLGMKESVELDEGSREADIKKTISIMKKYPANKGKSEKELRKGAIAYLDQYKKEEVELDEAIDFRKAFMDIQSYAKKNGGMDKTDFEKVAYYVKAIGDHQNTPNVANKAFMLMKKHIAGLDTDVRDGIHMLLKKHGMIKNGRMVQESISEGWRSGGGGYRDPFKAARRDAKYKELSHEYEDEKRLTRLKQMRKTRQQKKEEVELDEASLKTSDYPKGTSMSAQKFKDSQKKMSKQRALSTKDYPKGTSMSATAWKNSQEEVEVEDYSSATKSTDVGGKPLLRTDLKKAIDKKNIAKQNAMQRKYDRMHRESVELDEATTVSRADFDKLKKGDKITITYDSSIRKGTTTTFTVKGRSRSAKYNVDKISMTADGKMGNYFLYSRDGKDATLSSGDMAVTIQKYVKEDVDFSRDYINALAGVTSDTNEATILRTKTTRKQSDASKEKDKKKAVKTYWDIRKGKYSGVKMANEDDDPCWDSHKMVGMKKKGGKMVPNCVPK